MKINTQPSPHILGCLFVAIGSTCFSSKTILIKLAYQQTYIDPLSLLALRMLFSLPFFLVMGFIISYKYSSTKLTGKQWLYIALIGCLGYYVSSFLDFVGLQYIPAGIERLIIFIYPTFVVMISTFIFKKKVLPRQWIALALTYLGLVLVFWGQTSMGEIPLDKNFIFGCLLVFACSITFAIYTISSSHMITAIGSSKFNSYAMSFASLGVLTHFSIATEKSLLEFPRSVYWFGLLIAVLSTIISSYLTTAGLKRIGPKNTAIMASIGPVSTILLAKFFLDEPFFAVQLAGMVLILIGVMALSLNVRESPP